jgi:hypothetical protein
VPPGGVYLLFNQIKVIEQPFPSRRNPAVCPNRILKQVPDFDEDEFILGEPGKKPACRAPHAQFVQARQSLAVRLHLGATEKLRSQQRLGAFVFLRQAMPAGSLPEMLQVLEN